MLYECSWGKRIGHLMSNLWQLISKTLKKKVRFGDRWNEFGCLKGIEVMSNVRMETCNSQISMNKYPVSSCIHVYSTCINVFFFFVHLLGILYEGDPKTPVFPSRGRVLVVQASFPR